MAAAVITKTLSTCPVCAATLSAEVSVRDGAVWMEKECPQHGRHSTMAELNPSVYTALRAQSVPIYPSHFIDVTSRCNLYCSYCYYPCGLSEDPSEESIIQQALSQPVTTFFHGGEPTLRQDLPRMMERLTKHRRSGVPTNGIGLLNREYLQDVLRFVGYYGGVAKIALSWHLGLNDNTMRTVLESLRVLGAKVTGFVFTIRSKDDLRKALALSKEYQDCISETRIHVATDLWSTKDPTLIYVSGILRMLQDIAEEQGEPFAAVLSEGSLHWLPAKWGGMNLYIVRWYTRYDLDIQHLPLRPSYKAWNGEVVNILHGFAINEAMQRGWCKGVKMETAYGKGTGSTQGVLQA